MKDLENDEVTENVDSSLLAEEETRIQPFQENLSEASKSRKPTSDNEGIHTPRSKSNSITWLLILNLMVMLIGVALVWRSIKRYSSAPRSDWVGPRAEKDMLSLDEIYEFESEESSKVFPFKAIKPTVLPKSAFSSASQLNTIQSIEQEVQNDFIRVRIQTNQTTVKYEVIPLRSPNRISFVFPNIKKFRQKEEIRVSSNPLLRIRSRKQTKGVHVVFDLYPTSFPGYQVKELSGAVELFLYR